MKFKNILLFIFAAFVLIAILTIFLKKDYKRTVIKDINNFSWNDTIMYVRDYKDDQGLIIETRLQNFDTPFCFSGINNKLNILYLDYAKKGDIIIKPKNSDSFSIKKKDTILSFLLSKCN